MNGHQHYRWAEVLLKQADGAESMARSVVQRNSSAVAEGLRQADTYRAEAQVHATLALAAATAEARHTFHSEAGDGFTMSDQYYGEWADAFKTPAQIAEKLDEERGDH